MADESIASVESTHCWAQEFLFYLDSVLWRLDPADAPRSAYTNAGLEGNLARDISFLMHFGLDWRDRNDQFPDAFSEVQQQPIECCGEIESNAHWLCWILSQRILRRLCEAILPDYEIIDPQKVTIEESEYFSANWWAVSRAVRLENSKGEPAVDGPAIARLNAILNQEYSRAKRMSSRRTDYKNQFVANKLQQDILSKLNGVALKKQALADLVCAGEGSRLYRKDGIKELINAGLVEHKHGVGYYRPDAPPDGLIVPVD